MSCLPARTGRHRQRYMDQFRLVAGCIPFRLQKIVEDCNCSIENRLLVLMISSPNRDDLVFPKGGWEDDETIGEAACREALEEAGVKGILGRYFGLKFALHFLTGIWGLIEGFIRIWDSSLIRFSWENPLGVWEFRSKSRQNSCSPQGACRGHMFALEVTEELDSWPEQANRDRKWLTINEAFKFCRYDWMREALRKFLAVVSQDRTNGTRGELVEFHTMPVPDARAECQMLSTGFFVKPSGVQHLDESCSKCAVLG